jgi:methionine-rich copper-binding protein CopC
MKVRLIASSCLFALTLGAGVAAAGGPTAPMLLAANPENGTKLSKPPAEISFTFSEPLDGAYSRIEVYDECNRRVDVGDITVNVNEMSTTLAKKPSGKYKVYYFANAIPKGATGETDGITTFTAKKGRPC